MARRMFSPQIVSSDAFLDMPTSSRELYFQFGMYADDDGFVNPKRVMRLVGASEDDLKILISKRFVLPCNNGIIVIKHWRMNNLVRKDWYRPTQYVEQKRMFFLKENGSYTEDSTQGIPLVNELVNVGKDRIGKDRIGKEDTMSAHADAFDLFWDKYPKKELKKRSRDIWQRKKLDSSLKVILDFIEKALLTDRWIKGYIKQPPAFLNGECWNDDLTSYGDKKESGLKITRY